MRTDGQTRQTFIVAFRCLSKVPHKHAFHKAIRYPQRNQDSLFGVVTRPRVLWSAFGYRKGQRFLFSPKSSISTLGAT